mgnify:CR=1 FL=1
MAPEILEFFLALGVPVREGYGQTETGLFVVTPADGCRPGKAGIPVGPVNTFEELFSSEQVKALQTVQEVVHPKVGMMKVIKSPINYSKTPDEIRTPPSLLGEHTEEILADVLNMSEAEIEALKEKTII